MDDSPQNDLRLVDMPLRPVVYVLLIPQILTLQGTYCGSGDPRRYAAARINRCIIRRPQHGVQRPAPPSGTCIDIPNTLAAVVLPLSISK